MEEIEELKLLKSKIVSFRWLLESLTYEDKFDKIEEEFLKHFDFIPYGNKSQYNYKIEKNEI